MKIGEIDMLKKIETDFEGLYIIKRSIFTDNRGKFFKIFNKEELEKIGIEGKFDEVICSVSKKGVLRGMHFQLPPHEHAKFIRVVSGKILDVVVDLRKESKTFGEYFSIELDEDSEEYLYIPAGFAHGFLSLEENTIVVYATNLGYYKESDFGIRWNSFGFKWPIENPILSQKDKNLPLLSEFKSPF